MAFGVGMTLTRNRSPRDAARLTSAGPREGRLDELEERLDRMERLAAAPSTASGAAPAPFDQKVLAAIVNALDARLNEHAAGVEKRLAELDARLAVQFEALERQDRAIASGAQTRIEQAQAEFKRQVAAVGERAASDVAELRAEIVSVEREFAQAVARIVDERVQAQANAAASSSAAAIEEKLAPVRAELERKGRQIEDVSQALSDRDQAVLEFLRAFGRIRPDAAGGIAPPAQPAPPSAGEEPAAPPRPEPPQAEPSAAAPPAPEENPVPGFAQLRSPGRAWRATVVSSMMLVTGGLVLLRLW